MTIKEFKSQLMSDICHLYDVEEASQIVSWLLEDRLQLSRIKLKNSIDTTLDQSQLDQLQLDAACLIQAMPIQQILGYTEFYGLKIGVNTHTLIPRPETEELLDWILQHNAHKNPFHILDIGTGSACIALALKKHWNSAQIYALDISEEALTQARKNAQQLQLPISFIQADILAPTLPFDISEMDILVSNPPYIHMDESATMRLNVLQYEPHQALFVEEEDVLCFYKSIMKKLVATAKKTTQLYFEINEQYGQAIVELLIQQGFQQVQLKKDMQGKDRMIYAVYLVN
ncbi:MAG: peptide chain release factor N(5)-glutamine methyltransferase [Bacteroidota bacterium]